MAGALHGMETLIADACRQPLADIRQSQFELSGPDGNIILPRIWEATLQPNWTITIHFRQPENEDPQPENGRGDISEYRTELDRLERRVLDDREEWARQRMQEREQWERERERERDRWEEERVREKNAWVRERERERDRWEHERAQERMRWEREQEESRRRWEETQQTAREVCEGERSMPRRSAINENLCLWWLAGRPPRDRRP
ncbi:uncharacterized protein PV06_11218 [Exophiala oligosperma]|uniref:Ubiquitin-like domain-containing protein n=1 Tax=Exophiala oligosperma TaxID=215243 RepID=A0A0D2D2W2_9EURO|nr:uncharacterized protein PV06_11218 [Exophiala oligosperma]KIW36570.1 hypothetical protein PV06_11218 [Exophiala oligosperma]